MRNGGADFPVTNYAQIRTWWELVMCADLMICLHHQSFNPSVAPVPAQFQQNSGWDGGKGGKNCLNNIRLIVHPFIYFHLIYPWLKLFPIPQLVSGFRKLLALDE